MVLYNGQVLQRRYRIHSHVGHGGMGTVYQAQDTRLNNRAVAVKEFDPALLSLADQQAALHAFQREAAILAGLSHPGLTAVHDYFSENNKFYLVMEFVEGETLEHAWERAGRHFAEEQVVAWAKELCDVLDYLHSQQPPVIFRDLKPGNIMVQPDGRLKLIDFGIARHFTPGKTSDTMPFGTPGYAAPEQYGQGQTDARSDIYALGVVIHHLLTGYEPGISPFYLPDITTFPVKVSPSVATAVQQAVQMDAIKRPSSAADFCQMLSADLPITARHPSWLWFASSLVVLFIVAVTLFIVVRPQQQGKVVGTTNSQQISATMDATPSRNTPIPEREAVATTDDMATNAGEATVTLYPTPTPTLPATPSPTLLPAVIAVATFTPELVIAYVSLPLTTVANGEMDFNSPPSGLVTLQNIPFQIESHIFKSQASSAPYNTAPTRAVLPADMARAYRLYLLLNAGNGFLQFKDRPIGRLNVVCNETTYTAADLRLGREIREWHSANNVVSSASQVQQVWQGTIAGHSNLTGQIDMLIVDLPRACQDDRLTAIELEDTSIESVQSLDPALNLVAVTVEHYDQPIR